MYQNKNDSVNEPTANDGQVRRERRVLIVGRNLAGALLASLLEAKRFDVTVVPSPVAERGVVEREVADGIRPESIDSNQLGVRVAFRDEGTAYFDIAVETTGNWQVHEDQNPDRVAVVTSFKAKTVQETAITLATLTVLADALADSEAVPVALGQYRQWRNEFTKLNPGSPTSHNQ